ncbi:MAG: ABC transporter permease [Ruminococcaceae bacterium]|nr:ABC transporter permease [Oscillospiraceae bacterium]
MKRFFVELYAYREMLKSLVRKDLKTRYKGSFLGFLWTFINPLMQLAIYALIFPYLMRVDEKNYAMFLFVALLPWLFFSTSLQTSTDCIVENYNLVKKIYFPRQVLPLSVATGGLVNYIYGLVIVLIGLIVAGIPLTWNILFLPLLLLILYMTVSGFCLMFSAMNVYIRDLEHIDNIVTMAWFYATPIVYPLTMLPDWLQKILLLNPMTPLVQGFRNVIYYGMAPHWGEIGIAAIEAVVIFTLGVLIFNKLEPGFAEEI